MILALSLFSFLRILVQNAPPVEPPLHRPCAGVWRDYGLFRDLVSDNRVVARVERFPGAGQARWYAEWHGHFGHTESEFAYNSLMAAQIAAAEGCSGKG